MKPMTNTRFGECAMVVGHYKGTAQNNEIVPNLMMQIKCKNENYVGCM
jgi:hypothetical protein